MTEDQELVTDIYGWATVGATLIVLVTFLWGWTLAVMRIFRDSFDPRGEDQNINFSDVPSISAYVPQVESTVFSYPLLACSISGIGEDLLDWTDPDRPFSFYDLTLDAEVLLHGTDVSSKVVFSQMAHWPPTRDD